jgi:hypothetical protein
MTKLMGAANAESAGNAHEVTGCRDGNGLADGTSDLHNNEVGRNLAKDLPNKDCFDAALDATIGADPNHVPIDLSGNKMRGAKSVLLKRQSMARTDLLTRALADTITPGSGSLEIQPFSPTVKIGQALQLKVIIIGPDGGQVDVTNPLTGTQYIALDPDRIAVDLNGVVTGRKIGLSTVLILASNDTGHFVAYAKVAVGDDSDSDGDGRMDQGRDFVDGLNLATGLAFGHGGVFVLQLTADGLESDMGPLT